MKTGEGVLLDGRAVLLQVVPDTLKDVEDSALSTMWKDCGLPQPLEN